MKKTINLFYLIGIVLFIIILLKSDIVELAHVFLKLNYIYLLIAILLLFPFFFLKAMRWQYLLKMQGIKYGLIRAFFVYLSCVYMGIVTPGRIGEFVKIFYLKKDKGVSLGAGLSSTLIDRSLDIFTLLLVSFVGLLYLSLPLNLIILGLASLMIFVIILIVLFSRNINRKVALIFYRFIPKQFKEKLDFNFNEFYSKTALVFNPKLFVPVVYTILSFIVFFFQCYLLALALNINISLVYLTFSVATSNLITLIPITLSGVGTRDLALITLFSRVGLTKEQAIAYSFSFVILILFSGAIGLISWLKIPIKTE